jgi:uncharacterized protein (TIGR02413 family)
MPQGESRPAVFLCLKTGRKGVISCGLFVLIKWILLTDLVIKGREVIRMTLNIFFISVTFKRHKESLQEAERNEMIEKLYEQNKERQLSVYHLL